MLPRRHRGDRSVPRPGWCRPGLIVSWAGRYCSGAACWCVHLGAGEARSAAFQVVRPGQQQALACSPTTSSWAHDGLGAPQTILLIASSVTVNLPSPSMEDGDAGLSAQPPGRLPSHHEVGSLGRADVRVVLGPGRWVMLDETTLLRALRRHWEYEGKDYDISHEIYHDDAVLEFPNPANVSKVWRTSWPGASSTHPRSRSTFDESRSATIWWSLRISSARRQALDVLREPVGVQGRQGRTRADLHHGRLGGPRVAHPLAG